MIEENALVVAIEGDKVLLQTQRRSACQSCSVKQGCGTSVLAKVVGKRSSQILVNNTLNAKLGDQVRIGINDNALVKGSLLVYALPLIFLLVGGLLGEFLAHYFNLNAEWMSIAAGASGFFLAMILIPYGLSRSQLKNDIQPHMLSIIAKSTGNHEILLAP